MSLAIPKSKRKKIIIIIIILSAHIDADLDNDILDTNAERLMIALSQAQPVLESDPTSWTSEQSGVWDAIESISSSISTEDGNDEFGDYADELERALGNL